MEKLKSLADVITTFSSLLLSMLLLKLLPVGIETLMQILTLSGCGIARIEFALNLGNGGEVNGPATKPFLIQEAIESVTSGPNIRDALEFFTKHGPRVTFWNEGAPIDKYSKHFSARASSVLVKACLTLSTQALSLLVAMRDVIVPGRAADGKDAQKSLLGRSS
jgi:hypothetical protein